MTLKRIYRHIKKTLFGNPTISVAEIRDRGGIVGDNVYIGTGKIDMHFVHLLQIGNDVTISDARLLLHDASTKRALGYTIIGKIVIGNNVFVGADAIILPNVQIGNKVIIGAGCVVAKDIPDNSVVIGNPARIVSTYDEYIEKQQKIFLSDTTPRFKQPFAERSCDDNERIRNAVFESPNGGFDL